MTAPCSYTLTTILQRDREMLRQAEADKRAAERVLDDAERDWLDDPCLDTRTALLIAQQEVDAARECASDVWVMLCASMAEYNRRIGA